jgi:peroxiredoxin
MLSKRAVSVSAGLCALAVVVWVGCRYAMRGGTYVGQPLPDCRLTELGRSREVDAGELRKGRVLLVYLTTDCRHCFKEAEIISRLRREVPPEVKIYGVAIESKRAVEDFARQVDLTFPVLLDDGARLVQSFDIHNFPTKFLVEDGIVTHYWRGTTRDEAELRRLLENK